MSRLAALAVAAVLALAALPCRAAPPDEATKAAARKIAQEGLTLYDSGKYQEALERFVQADAMVHAPTMLLMAARSLVKLGRLIEAADRYTAASQAILDAQASDAFRKAVADAATEREALLARIPSILLTVDSPAGVETTVTIDGVAIPSATLGQKRLIEPGAHTIEARGGGVSTTARVDLKEGESRPIHLVLQTAPSGALRITGWTVAGLGVAGIAMGAITGGLAAAKNDELSAAGCKDGFCPLSAAKGLDEYDTLKTLSSAGIIGGVVALAAGVTLVIVAPAPKPVTTGIRLSPFVGLGSAGVRGEF